MVQREVGERLAARPGGGDYGVPSVLAQLACEVQVVLRRSRAACFTRCRTSTRCSSACGARSAAPSVALRALVAGPSRTGARRSPARLRLGASGGELSREQVREALVALGHPADVRAERLSPEDFRALAAALEL